MSSPRTFAIIPAAGHSRRMGAPKLLLAWRASTILDQVLRTWTESLVSKVFVVIRADDQPLEKACRNWPVEIVRPGSDPGDMKQSVQYGLQHIEAVHRPSEQDRWLVAPADLPGLTVATINEIVSRGWKCDSILLPRYGSHRGHPVSFPWNMAADALELDEQVGIDSLLAEHPVTCIDFPAESAIEDIDTPDDYRRLSGD